MKSVEMFSGLPKPTFAVSEADPNYWTLRADYEYVSLLERLHYEGVGIDRVEESDLTSLESSVDAVSQQLPGYLSALHDYLNDTTGTLVEPTMPTLPSLLPVLLLLTIPGAGGAVGGLLADLAINIGMSALSKQVSRISDNSEIVGVLRELLRTSNHNINIADVLQKALFSGGDTANYSLLWAQVAQAVRIIVHGARGDLDDVLLESSAE